MYICICNAIKETDLRTAALTNSGDAETVYGCFGKKPQCRQCLILASKILDEERLKS